MHLAVIGAGVRGRAFALACARSGLTVTLEDVMPEKLRRAADEFASLDADVQLVATVEDAVRTADIVIDFVPDELESKLEILSLVDRMAPPHTILCTPSQTLSITDLASCSYRADRCIMVRGPLSPATSVQLISAADTSDATRSAAQSLFTALGHPVELLTDPDLPMLLKNMNAPTL